MVARVMLLCDLYSLITSHFTQFIELFHLVFVKAENLQALVNDYRVCRMDEFMDWFEDQNKVLVFIRSTH